MRSRWWMASVSTACAFLCVMVSPQLGDRAPVPRNASPSSTFSPEGLPDYVGLPGVAASLSHRVDTVPLASAGESEPVSNPAWLAYDHATSTFYVATPPSSIDAVPFNAGDLQVAASIPVGSGPFGVAVDNATGDVFVTNTGSDNVSVLSNATDAVVASISVGVAPYGIAYDTLTGDLYVANAGSDNVSVISGATLSVVASVSVGPGPLGVAFDPASGDLFVADHGASEVSVLAGASEEDVASVAVGLAPYGVAVDPTTDTVFVTNEGSSNVSVISAASDQTVATVPVVYPFGAGDLQGIAYDARDGLIWAGAGSFYAVVIDPSSEAVADFVNTDPSGVVFDPDSGDVCVTNTANVTFECFLFPSDTTPSSTLTFDESGLPTGTAWSVNLSSTSPLGPSSPYPIVSSTTASLSAGVLEDVNYHFEARPTGDYDPSPSTGQVLVRGASSAVDLTYYRTASLYLVNFTQTGLPAGSSWYVNISGYPPLEGTGATLSLVLPNGTYPFSAAAGAPAFSAPGGSVVVDGASLNVSVPFSERFYNVTFIQTDLPAGTAWSVNVSVLGSASSTGPNAFLTAPNGTYTFTSATPDLGWRGDGGSFRVSGAALAVPVTFVALNYSVSVNETGLPADLVATRGWTASLYGISNHTLSASAGFRLPNGTYGLLVTGPAGYASNASGHLTVHGATHLTVAFLRGRTLTLTFLEHGLAKGQPWCVEVNAEPSCSVTGSVKYSGLAPESYTYGVGSPLAGQTIVARLGTTDVALTGGAVAAIELTSSARVALTFTYPYTVTFTETGLASGSWSVTIRGQTRTAGSGDAIAFELANGTYRYAVGSERHYSSSGSPRKAAVRGGSASIAVTFRAKSGQRPTLFPSPGFGVEMLLFVPVVSWKGGDEAQNKYRRTAGPAWSP